MLRRLIVASLLLTSACASVGFRKTNQSTSVSVTGGQPEIDTLYRSQYQVLDQAEGAASARQFFLLWFPVGAQKSRAALIDDAYYKAADTIEGCDALLVPRTKSKTIVIPLIFVNIVNRSVRLKGRCVRVLNNDELAPPPDQSSK